MTSLSSRKSWEIFALPIEKGQKHDFLKRPIKRRILTLFLGLFWLDINSKNLKTSYFD